MQVADVCRECRVRGLGSGDFREEGISGKDQEGGSDEVLGPLLIVTSVPLASVPNPH